MTEPHLRTVRPDDEYHSRITDLENEHKVFAVAIERRMAALERWQAFVFGAAAAIGALVGLALAILGMLVNK